MAIPLPLTDSHAPEVPLHHLDQLWFQLAGTICNYTCRHCFISCSPHNHSFDFLSWREVEPWLDESVKFGVREYYFTGGEPFLNPEATTIIERTLEYGPASVLTNASVLRDEWLKRLRAAEDRSGYSLEWRVSLDGFTPEMNDPIRGEGTFERTMCGVRRLIEYDFLPIITVTVVDETAETTELFDGFVKMLRDMGYSRPRLKILPPLRIGAEADRCRGYAPDERVTAEMLADFDMQQLLCSHARLVSDRGVHVCPILLEAPDSVLGQSLMEASRPFALRYQACWTCYQHGSICSNPSGSLRDG
ncbi:MAG: radical SAM protein [Gemmataceae bacterium]|nr:radical SAM protein [Gemmataceae bacterium]